MSRHVALLNRRRRLSHANIVTAGLVSSGLVLAALLLAPRAQPVASASAANGRVSPRVTVVQKDVIGDVSTPPVVTIVPAPDIEHAPVSLDARHAAPARRRAPEPVREGLPHRVAKFFTGDGRHTVRPFPTPSPGR